MNNPNTPITHQLVLTFEDGALVNTQVLTERHYVLTLADYEFLLDKAGLATVPKAVAEYLSQAAGLLIENKLSAKNPAKQEQRT